MESKKRSRRGEIAIGLVFAGLAAATAANHLMHGEEKKDFCDGISDEMTTQLVESGLAKKLKENVSGNGVITLTFKYKSEGGEFSQFPITGRSDCDSKFVNIDLTLEN